MLKDDRIVVIVSNQVWPKSRQWKTERKHGRKTSEIGFKVRLEFAEGVSGPIGIGYTAHLGLGCLLPEQIIAPQSFDHPKMKTNTLKFSYPHCS
jgi:hypothetical protein